MTNKSSIAFLSGFDGGVVLLALQGDVVSCLYDGNEKVKTKGLRHSSSFTPFPFSKNFIFFPFINIV
ncbi:MAG: hypothetical protein GY834_05120 [Bacteroidetes bacterium]|nr:hypothetical protein [Bacteroidota bacterium]